MVGISPRKPEVHVLKVQVKKANLTTVELLVRLSIQNPNSFDLRFSHLQYQLFFHEKPLAEGERKEDVIIKENSTEEVEVPVTVHTREALLLLPALLHNEKPKVKWTAKTVFISPLGQIQLEFEEEKSFL
jgi:LEA14-like dessication related protein